MRKVLFRGRREDGRWVYGGFFNHLKRTPCPAGDRIRENDWQALIISSGFSDWNMPKPLESQVVVCGTVGQYTGIDDCKGNKIFEGDIVSFKNVDLPPNKVGWDKALASFALCDKLGCWNCLDESMRMEVVGNIHDNPELMEEAVE